MITVTGGSPADTQRIYATRSPDKTDRQTLQETLDQLAASGGLTNRDERLLESLRELRVISVDQAYRLWWSSATKPVTAYKRLNQLRRRQLLAAARTPRTGMLDWWLPVGKVYGLGPGGRLWLREETDGRDAGYLKRNQVLHDLLVVEVYVRLYEAVRQRGSAWSLTWSGEQGVSFYNSDDGTPVLAPDGLAIVRQRRADRTPTMPMFIELDSGREAHGRPSSDWGRKIIGYDRVAASKWEAHPAMNNLDTFPRIHIITHGNRRLLNLIEAIKKHRQQPLFYQLALWEDLVEEPPPAAADKKKAQAPPRERIDFLTAPAWVTITPEGHVIGAARKERLPLLSPPE